MAEAAAAGVLQRLDDLIECSIHQGPYENPRQLPCLHSFCLQCLVNYMKDKPLANNITCPLCRRETTVPADGIEGFPRNFFIDKIIEIKRLTGPLQKDTSCDICKEDEELPSDSVSVASMFCAECRKNLCDRCTKEHRRHNKSHSVLEMGNGDINDELVKKLEVSFCKDHSGKAVEMFCLDCQAVICIICFAEKHKLHNCSDINNSAKDFRKQMEREIDTISVCLSEGKKTKETTDKKKDEFLQQIKSVERKILERREELRRIIDRDSNLLLEELKIIKSSHLKEMQIKDEELQRHLTIIASLKAYGKEILSVGSASDICRSLDQFATRTKEVQATVEEAPFCEVVCRSISFQSTEFKENLERNSLGKLEVHCETHLVKDFSDEEKSLWETLHASPGNKDKTTRGEGQLTDHQGQMKQHKCLSRAQGQVAGLQEKMEKNSSPSKGQGQATGHQGRRQQFTDPVIPDQGQIFHPNNPPLMKKQFLIKYCAADFLHFKSNRSYNVLNIFVYNGNIVDQRTQFLVSPANCQLTTHGSVSEAILRAAGQSVVDECSQINTARGFLPFGAVVPTKAGNLGPHVEIILHAIIPTLQEFQIDPVQAFNALSEIFFNCLCISTRQAKSVSFPAIGSEIFGLQRMVEAFICGSRAYDRCASSLPVIFSPGEIHLISKDPNKLKTILGTLLPLVA